MGNDRSDEELSEEMIDATLADSFPASDPPSWTLGREKHGRPAETSKKALPKAATRAIKKEPR